jgi:hypothetical protein
LATSRCRRKRSHRLQGTQAFLDCGRVRPVLMCDAPERSRLPDLPALVSGLER